MKLLSKSVLGCALLSSVMGLTACQNMPMDQRHMAHDGQPTNNVPAVEKLTEAHVIKVLSVANNGEIMQADIAMPNLETAEVREFAQNMIEKHTMNEQKTQALATKLQLVPAASYTSNGLQVDSNNIVTQLNLIPAPADKAYITSQINVHGKVLSIIDNQLLPSTNNSELRKFLMETRSVVAMHLQMAQQLNAKL